MPSARPHAKWSARRGLLLTFALTGVVACQSRPRATSDVMTKESSAPPAVDAAVETALETSAAPAVAADGEDEDLEADADAGVKLTDVESANAFALALYKKIRAAKGNLVVSGTSLRSACGMAQLGANGGTAVEMAAALRTEPDPLRAAEHAKAERADWAAVVDSELSIANHVWVSSRFAIQPAYLAAVAGAYGARADTLDFRAPDKAKGTINRWASDKTKKKIPEIISSIDPHTAAILTNAVYFNGRWNYAFPTYLTWDEPFYLDRERTTTVPTMHLFNDELPFASVAGAKVIQKAYGKRGRMAMLLVLPDRVDGLEELEASLSVKKLRSWVSSLAVRTVALSLPRFKIERELPMVAVLKDLGMKSAFDPDTADFSRLASGGLFVSDVVQKALIEVDLQGTVAVAATGLIDRAEPTKRTPFVADHPFLFLLRDTQTGRILFMGRVTDPKAG